MYRRCVPWPSLAAAAMALDFLFLLVPAPALAHVTQEAAGGFASGFSHPLKGPDHFLAMFAVGLWGAQMGGRSVWTLPVTFPLIMALGGLAGMMELPLPRVELGVALSIIGLGSSIAFAWRPAQGPALLVVGTFAVFHGYAHGIELPWFADPADYAVGFVVATGLIHLSGIAVGLSLTRPLNGRLAQVLGGVIAAAGGYFLAA